MFLFLFGCVSPSPHAFSSSKGINTVSTKLAADLYGHDLDDLRILSHCKLMPGPSAASMTSSPRVLLHHAHAIDA